jgi:hypothetical protein
MHTTTDQALSILHALEFVQEHAQPREGETWYQRRNVRVVLGEDSIDLYVFEDRRMLCLDWMLKGLDAVPEQVVRNAIFTATTK